MSTNGRFVWYDLLTPSPDQAVAYYTHVLGWGTETWDGPMKYTMWTAQGTPVGGVAPLPAEGVPPHWLGYIETADIKASAERVTKLGGKVLNEPDEIPDMGWYAVAADPQGAVFGLYQSKDPEPQAQAERGARGRMSWAELNTTDYEGAWKFYAALAGWKPTTSMEMDGGLGKYFMFDHANGDGTSMGGMSNAATMMGAPAHWLFYTNVEDIDAAIKRVSERGGKVLNGPMDVPGGDKIAQCSDPQGAFFAIYAKG